MDAVARKSKLVRTLLLNSFELTCTLLEGALIHQFAKPMCLFERVDGCKRDLLAAETNVVVQSGCVLCTGALCLFDGIQIADRMN